MGWLADRFSKKYVMLLTYLLVAAGIPLLFLGRNPSLAPRVSGRVRNRPRWRLHDYPFDDCGNLWHPRSGRLLGVILTAGGVAEAVSPWLTGRLRDATGDYSTGCFLLVGVALLGAIAVLGLPERRKVV